MPAALSLFFEVHQPYALEPFTFFDIGTQAPFISQRLSQELLQQQASAYQSVAQALLQSLDTYPDLHLSLSFSGTTLAQWQNHAPQLIEPYTTLARHERVQLAMAGYYHSLAALKNPTFFVHEVNKQKKLLEQLFNKQPVALYFPEFIYQNQLGVLAHELGFKMVLSEGNNWFLSNAEHIRLMHHPEHQDLNILVCHKAMSSKINQWLTNPDLKERFLNAAFEQHYLSDMLLVPIKLPQLISQVGKGIATVTQQLQGLFEAARHNAMRFTHIGQFAGTPALEPYSVPRAISAAPGVEDLSAWQGNFMQTTALKKLYRIVNQAQEYQANELLEKMGPLLSHDHLYNLRKDKPQSGPYDAAHDQYIFLMNILAHAELQLKALSPGA